MKTKDELKNIILDYMKRSPYPVGPGNGWGVDKFDLLSLDKSRYALESDCNLVCPMGAALIGSGREFSTYYTRIDDAAELLEVSLPFVAGFTLGFDHPGLAAVNGSSEYRLGFEIGAEIREMVDTPQTPDE